MFVSTSIYCGVVPISSRKADEQGLFMMTLVSEISMVAAGPTDGVLVGQVLAGQKSAFDELVSRYQRRATAVAYRLLGNLQDALEVAQESFLKAFTNLTTLQKSEAFGPWLLRIVSNLSLNLRRSRKSLAVLPLDDLLPSSGATNDDHSLIMVMHDSEPSRRMQRAEVHSRIEQALGQLSRRQREAISLFALEEIPQKQVAQTLGCSVEAVKWHVFEGRRKLREILKDCL
jgi:RNA polymerase sigma-70 factor, ECF subfamily